MGYYSKKNLEKKQWFVVDYNAFSVVPNCYYVGLNHGKMESANKEPLTFEEADKFRRILNKLYGK